MNRNHQIVPVDYLFNNDLKYLQGGILTMTYTTSITKTNAAQYDLQGIKDMVPNIWSPVKVSYDKYALWGISHWRQERKTFYGYVRGLESSHDVYSIKHILVVTRAEVMKKHGYGYLREIGVRRADNDLYTFKEGDFPPISWAMMFLTLCSPEAWLFKRESKIFNWESKVTRRRSTNKLMRSDELYKFSDGTLTRLRTSLDNVTKNIRIGVPAKEKMEFLGKEKSSYHDQGD
ncbi:hypothetical protein Tco_1254672 [Tanacetum coccineum]